MVVSLRPVEKSYHVHFVTPYNQDKREAKSNYRKTPFPKKAGGGVLSPEEVNFKTPSKEEDEVRFNVDSCRPNTTKSVHFESDPVFLKESASFVETPAIAGLLNALGPKETPD